MKGVVPAAGRGTRLESLTDEKPKALVDVGGRPLLSHVLETLAPHVSEYVVVVGYRGDQIRDRYGDSFDGVPVTYVEQVEPRGLADAILQAEPVVDADFLQLNGDNVLRANVDELVDAHWATDADATLLVDRVTRERARRGGVLAVDDDGEVEGLVEKPDDPPSRLATTGCFAFSPRIFEACRAVEPSARGEYELTDAIAWLLGNSGTVEAVDLDGWRVNVNTLDDVERAEGRL